MTLYKHAAINLHKNEEGSVVQWLKNMNTAKKIIGLILLNVIFTGIVGYIGFQTAGHIQASQQAMYETNLLPIKWINEASAQSRAALGLTLEVLLVDMDKKKEQKLLNEAKERMDAVQSLLGKYETTLPESDKEKITLIKQMLETYHANRHKAIEMAMAGRKKEAYTYFAENASGHVQHVNTVLEEVANSAAKQAADREEHSSKEAAMALKATVGITLATSLGALVLGGLLARMIVRPLQEMVVMAEEMAAGNLQGRAITFSSEDEVGQLSRAFTTMASNLRQLVQQVALLSSKVAVASGSLTAGAEQSAQSATQIAASIAEVAAGSDAQSRAVQDTTNAVERMSADILQAATHANAVVAVAKQSADVAESGSKAVGVAVQQMGRIATTVSGSAGRVAKLGERSLEIGQIIDTISGIARQTNLLALNAAIEAARAGEQGKGFSVVAEEVRRLAEQSQEAAKQIEALIREIQDETAQAVTAMQAGTHEVEVGATVIDTAGEAFSQIALMVSQLEKQVQDINSAIQHMESSSERIVHAVREIRQVGQQTVAETQHVSAATEEQAATVQEIAAASQQLAQMSQALAEDVRQFKV